uniref:SH3 domain-containing protein n=1 Tax=Gopherus evgoodei TaxID=1825980 RepID=A0A8C4VVK3_9SAUR
LITLSRSLPRQIEDGWWLGRKNGQVGAFPSNFVQELDRLPPGRGERQWGWVAGPGSLLFCCPDPPCRKDPRLQPVACGGAELGRLQGAKCELPQCSVPTSGGWAGPLCPERSDSFPSEQHSAPPLATVWGFPLTPSPPAQTARPSTARPCSTTSQSSRTSCS